MDDTLQRKTHNAFASLCVSIKAILTASSRTRREAFFSCPIAEWRTNKTTPLANPRRRWIVQQLAREKGKRKMCCVQTNNREFIIEWIDEGLTALKVTSGENTSIVRFDSDAKCLLEMGKGGASYALLESLEDCFCELTGIRLDISNVFLNLLRVDHGSGVEQKIFFADFPDAAKDKFNKEIRKISKSWRFKGDEVEREVKLKEFISYVIYFRRFFSFVGCESALNVGLIYINKVWLEDEWLAFNQDTEALCQKLSLPVTNGIVQYHLEEAKRLTDIWRKPNNSSWKYFAKEV